MAKCTFSYELLDALDALVADDIHNLLNTDFSYDEAITQTTKVMDGILASLASKLGLTGYQVSSITATLFERAEHIKGPYVVIPSKELLYPGSYLAVKDTLNKLDAQASEEAYNLLKEYNFVNRVTREYYDDGFVDIRHEVHPKVWSWWQELAAEYTNREDKILTLCLTGK